MNEADLRCKSRASDEMVTNGSVRRQGKDGNEAADGVADLSVAEDNLNI